ncbi:MAG: paraquat-inducible protein A [Thiohalobacterales bacterium]
MRARDAGMTGCHTCGLLQRVPADGHAHCPRCSSAVHLRTPDSINMTWALLISAMAMYLPANMFPVMVVTSLGNTQSDTIMSGVIYFLVNGDWPLALIIFIASVLVPLLKMITLVYLLLSVQRKSPLRKQQRTKLYRMTELVGRWSMVDIFVVALMVALVQFGNLATIDPGIGAIAFAAVVILTMFAAMRFDSRLIWDH